MSDLTTLFVTIVALLVVGGGAVAGIGPSGPSSGAADLGAQETTTQDGGQANETTTQDDGAREPDRQETTQGGETTQADGMGQTGNQTTQAGGTQGGANTNVTARNVTIDTLVLRNVTVQNAQFGTLTVTNATTGNASQTYQNVSAERIETTGNVTDLTLTNVSFNSETLASNLVNETGRQRIDTRLVMDLAVLQNHTVDGLVVENATVAGSAVENISVSQGGANATGTDADGQTESQPALSADTAVVKGVNVTALEVTGLSLGETTQGATTTANETTASNATTTTTATSTVNATTTAAGDKTTTAAEESVVVNTTTEAQTTTAQ